MRRGGKIDRWLAGKIDRWLGGTIKEGLGIEEGEYKYVYPSTDKYRMNIGKEDGLEGKRRMIVWEGRWKKDWEYSEGNRRGLGGMEEEKIEERNNRTEEEELKKSIV